MVQFIVPDAKGKIKPMNKEKLLAIAEMLRSIPQEKFDMEFWKNSCGTICCAVGWAIEKGLLPGLELATIIYPDSVMGVTKRFQPKRKGGERDPESGFIAVAEELGIDTAEVEYLFTELDYELDVTIEADEGREKYKAISPGAVADRIEKFVRTDGGRL